MLMPKRVKYRKQTRGRMTGKALRGADVQFGEFGLQRLNLPGSPNARLKRPGVPSCATSSAVVASGYAFSLTSP